MSIFDRDPPGPALDLMPEARVQFVEDTNPGPSGTSPPLGIHLYTDCPLTIDEMQTLIAAFGYDESLAVGVPSTRLVALFYLLLRDHLPVGAINDVMQHIEKTDGKDVEFQNVHLTALAQSLANRLIGEAP